MKFLISTLLLLSFSSLASAANNCWQKEINPTTVKVYSSQAEWQKHVDYWNAHQAALPNPLNLITAYNIYKSEYARVNKFKNDKLKHCYVGCKIAQATTLRTTEYVGWYKELKDITDCDISTHFEIRDFQATVHGGQIGATSSGANCQVECVKAWGAP